MAAGIQWRGGDVAVDVSITQMSKSNVKLTKYALESQALHLETTKVC